MAFIEPPPTRLIRCCTRPDKVWNRAALVGLPVAAAAAAAAAARAKAGSARTSRGVGLMLPIGLSGSVSLSVDIGMETFECRWALAEAALATSGEL